MKNKVENLVVSLIVVLIITDFVLPGRPTPAVVKSFFDLFNGSLRGAFGLAPTVNTSSSSNPLTDVSMVPGNVRAHVK